MRHLESANYGQTNFDKREDAHKNPTQVLLSGLHAVSGSLTSPDKLSLLIITACAGSKQLQQLGACDKAACVFNDTV